MISANFGREVVAGTKATKTAVGTEKKAEKVARHSQPPKPLIGPGSQ